MNDFTVAEINLICIFDTSTEQTDSGNEKPSA